MSDKFVDPLGKSFEFPKTLLNQVSECSPEGYILFYIDMYGNPQVEANFLHSITEMGLRSFATKFLKGMNTVEDSNIADNISKNNLEEDSEE